MLSQAHTVRTSIIIAAHNEGEALWQTVRSCVETCAGLDYEIVVADDASVDYSVEEAHRRFPQPRVVRHDERRGAAPTKDLGAREARGDVFVFLDGHCNPEPGAIARLVRDIEDVKGNAIVTPAIAGLDTQRWRNVLSQVGHGHFLDLEKFDCGWLPLSELRAVDAGRRRFYESPALIGCVLAVSRVGRATISPLGGSLLRTICIDPNQHVSCDCGCGCGDDSGRADQMPICLVYNSGTTNVQPIIQVTMDSCSCTVVPSQIQAQLTFNGVAQGWIIFGTSDHNLGDVYALLDLPTNGGHPVKSVNSLLGGPLWQKADASTPASSNSPPSNSSPKRATPSPRPLDVFYNVQRRHSSLGYVSPAEYEQSE